MSHLIPLRSPVPRRRVCWVLIVVGLLINPAGAADPGSAPEAAAPPGYLGVMLEPIRLPADPPETARVRIQAVLPATPAAESGLEPGDVILAIDEAPLVAPRASVRRVFRERVQASGAGTALTLTVRRAHWAVATRIGDEPPDSPAEASGPQALGPLLPDLPTLLRTYPDRWIEVLARQTPRTRTVTVTLAPAPGWAGDPLPPNPALRPDLAALPPGPAVAVVEALIARAQRDGDTAAAAYADLQTRFARAQRADDPFRLATVRYLHREPLRLSSATRQIANELAAIGANGPGGVLDPLIPVARRALDAKKPASAAPAGTVPSPPAEGASPGAYADFAAARIVAARGQVEAALADLDAPTRAALDRDLPTLASVFAERFYLFADPDPARWARHSEALDALAAVDRGALLDGLTALAILADPAWLTAMARDLAAATAGTAEPGSRLLERRGSGDAGVHVIIGGAGPNEYTEPADVIIDLGGDDRYRGPVAAATGERPAVLVVDLAGDDTYQANRPFAQGAARLGVALLVDRAGDDRYVSNAPFAQGASAAGVAVLADLGGADTYRGSRFAQGSALVQGLAALIDRGGDDLHHARLHAQGFAGPGSLGLLLTQGGDDRYIVSGGPDGSYGGAGTYRGMSQGAAVGFRHLASGGIAALVDTGGRDRYRAGNFSQGGGYYYGWGLLADRGAGDDDFEGSRYAQGFAAHSALGSFWDAGGDDRYRSVVGAAQSAAWDQSATAFLDDAGDDVSTPGRFFALGAAAHNGFALFVDGDGADRYGHAPARARPNDYHGGASLALFLDAGGGADRYPATLEAGLTDGGLVTRDQFGIGVDLPGPLSQIPSSLFDRWTESTEDEPETPPAESPANPASE